MSDFQTKSYGHGIDLGKHQLKGGQLSGTKFEAINAAVYNALPTTGALIGGYDKRLFIVMLGAGMAFLATTNLTPDGTTLVKSTAGQAQQVATLMLQVADLIAQNGTQQTAIDGLIGRMSQAETNILDVTGRTTALEGTVGTQGTQIGQNTAAIAANLTAQGTINQNVQTQIGNVIAATGAIGFVGHSIANNNLTLNLKIADGSIQSEVIPISSFVQDVQISNVVEDANGFSFTIQQTAGGAPKQVNLAGIIEAYLVSVFQVKFTEALNASDVLRIDTAQALTAPQKAAVLAKIGAASTESVQAVNDKVGDLTGIKGLDDITDIVDVAEGLDVLRVKLAQAQLNLGLVMAANRKDELTNVTLAPGANYFSPGGDTALNAPRISPAVRVLNGNGYEEGFVAKTEMVAGVRVLCITNLDSDPRTGMIVAIDW